MNPLSFPDARAMVLRHLADAARPATETVDILDAGGRVLAREVRADRDYPASTRSVRDGFAIRAADSPGTFRVTGEVRAGDPAVRAIAAGEAIEIMTGAPLPPGADAVVMVEHVARAGDRITTDRSLAAGEHLNVQGCEARAGDVLLGPGVRLDYAGIALLATAGLARVEVYRRPRVAIAATGDEIVEVAAQPLAYQVRNSNACSLAVQVRRGGGEPVILPIARDNHDSTRAVIEQGLMHDLLLLSGGVSAGKYDLVEPVLAGLGAEFFFTRVLVQPGQPLVFGRVRSVFFFGLPGNPASTMLTFEVFARAALEMLGGQSQPELPVTLARLTEDFRQRPGLTRFLPARLDPDGARVTPLPWKGSGDVPALARSNAFLVTEPEREAWAAGDLIRVLLK